MTYIQKNPERVAKNAKIMQLILDPMEQTFLYRQNKALEVSMGVYT